VGRRVARDRRGVRHRPGQRDGQGDHRRGAPPHRVHQTGHDRIRRLRRQGGRVRPGAGLGHHRHPRRDDPGDGDRLRHRPHRPDLLDARHHRAPHRHRQRPRPHQPGAPHRSRRPLRVGAGADPGPEQRPGGRGHGRPAQQAPRVSRTSRTPRTGPSSSASGGRRSRPSGAGISPRCSRRWRPGSCGVCT
jgi:hypothetical protein